MVMPRNSLILFIQGVPKIGISPKSNYDLCVGRFSVDCHEKEWLNLNLLKRKLIFVSFCNSIPLHSIPRHLSSFTASLTIIISLEGQFIFLRNTGRSGWVTSG